MAYFFDSFISFLTRHSNLILGMGLTVFGGSQYLIWNNMRQNYEQHREAKLRAAPSTASNTELQPKFPLGYADCMADTYYYGYLRQIFTKSNSGLNERIQFYKEANNISDNNFPFKKLFIVIPSRGHVPSLLDELDPRIEVGKPMDPLELDRAGVKTRVYKTSIYRIKVDDNFAFYVPLEGAPPLLCLSDSCKENKDLNEHKTELIYQFYQKVNEKLKHDPDMEESVELVYWNNEKKSSSLADELASRYYDKMQGI